MTYEQMFAKVKKSFAKASSKSFTAEFAFQFNITGEGEGIFYVCNKNGEFSVEPYDYKDRDVIFTADGATFVAIAEGKLEPIDAMNNGKLFIDGSYELSKQLLSMVPVKKTVEKKPAAKKAEPKKTEEKKPAEKKACAKAEAPKACAKTEAPKAAVKAEAPKAAAKPAAKAEEKKPAAKTTKASK